LEKPEKFPCFCYHGRNQGFLSNENGEPHRIGLISFPFSARQLILRLDGKVSDKAQETSFTQVCEKMHKLLIVMAKQKSCTKNR